MTPPYVGGHNGNITHRNASLAFKNGFQNLKILGKFFLYQFRKSFVFVVPHKSCGSNFDFVFQAPKSIISVSTQWHIIVATSTQGMQEKKSHSYNPNLTTMDFTEQSRKTSKICQHHKYGYCKFTQFCRKYHVQEICLKNKLWKWRLSDKAPKIV